MGKADIITYKHLAHLLSENLSSPYYVVMKLPVVRGSPFAALFNNVCQGTAF